LCQQTKLTISQNLSLGSSPGVKTAVFHGGPVETITWLAQASFDSCTLWIADQGQADFWIYELHGLAQCIHQWDIYLCDPLQFQVTDLQTWCLPRLHPHPHHWSCCHSCYRSDWAVGLQWCCHSWSRYQSLDENVRLTTKFKNKYRCLPCLLWSSYAAAAASLFHLQRYSWLKMAASHFGLLSNSPNDIMSGIPTWQ
jgi:hypothetical protein